MYPGKNLLKYLKNKLQQKQKVDHHSCLLVPKGLYCAWKWCRLTADGVIHETLTFKDDRLANFEGKLS